MQTKQKKKQRKNNEQKLKKYLDSYGESKVNRQNSADRMFLILQVVVQEQVKKQILNMLYKQIKFLLVM
jgi:hypothetical protein